MQTFERSRHNHGAVLCVQVVDTMIVYCDNSIRHTITVPILILVCELRS